MAIQPVSDLIMDVINQADPAEARAATRALKAPAVVSKDLPVTAPSWIGSGSFAQAMSEAESGLHAAKTKASDAAAQGITSANRYSSKIETMDLGEKLEATILQSFVKSMLPKELETVYGGGMAGSMWQGLMAEQMANQLAKSGAVGLSDMLMDDSIRPVTPKKEA